MECRTCETIANKAENLVNTSNLSLPPSAIDTRESLSIKPEQPKDNRGASKTKENPQPNGTHKLQVPFYQVCMCSCCCPNKVTRYIIRSLGWQNSDNCDSTRRERKVSSMTGEPLSEVKQVLRQHKLSSML